MARADKAEDELGWQTRPVGDGMRDTLDWVARTVEKPKDMKTAAGLILALAAVVAGIWFLTRRRREN